MKLNYLSNLKGALHALVKKLSGTFIRHPILGPMYAPAYHVGTGIVADAIAQHGVLPVARIGMYLDGIVDIQTFQRKLQYGGKNGNAI